MKFCKFLSGLDYRANRKRPNSVLNLNLIIILIPVVIHAAIIVSTSGSDISGDGTLANPYASIQYAENSSSPGDTIMLRGGTYNTDEIRIDTSNLTIRSYPGEWAIVQASVDYPDTSCVFWYRPYDHFPVIGGIIEHLEIIGGYYYALKIDGSWGWDTCYTKELIIQDCIIHDSGRDCIKITPGCDDLTIRSCEIYNSGIGPANSGYHNAEGIDNVNGDNCVVQNCYIHDISTNGIYIKGGAIGCLIQNNLIWNCGSAGVLLGFYTDSEWFDTLVNPNYYENIDGTVKNNIIIEANWAGIGAYSALRPTFYNNTIIACADTYHAALFFNRGSIWINDSVTLEPQNVDVTVLNNLFMQKASTANPIVRIRPEALTGTIVIDYNRYFTPGGAEFMDDNVTWERMSLSAWSDSTGFDINSSEGDPGLDSNYHLISTSPCIDSGFTVTSVTQDYDGGTRSGLLDIGADEFASGTPLEIPPPYGTIGTGNPIITGYTHDYYPSFPENISISAYPNPFNSAVSISVETQNLASLQIEIFDLAGRRVAELPSPSVPLPGGEGGDSFSHWEKLAEGRMRAFTWQPAPALPSGVYLVRARFASSTGSGHPSAQRPGDESVSKRIVYLK